MSSPSTSTRICFTIEREVELRWQTCGVPYGLKSQLMSRMFSMLVDSLEAHGLQVMALLLAGDLELKAKEKVNVETR